MMSHESISRRIRSGPICWEEELPIPTDAVVSKTLLDLPTGTITAFAFDQGQGLREHTAPFDALIHLLSGNLTVRVEENASTLKEGESILLPAGIPHALKAISPSRLLLIMIKSKSR